MNSKKANKKYSRSFKILTILVSLSLIFYQCAGNRINRYVGQPSELASLQLSDQTPFIKLHTKNGDVYVLEAWKVMQKENQVVGTGTYLDINRKPIEHGEFKVPISEVVIAETNVIGTSASTIALAAATVFTGIFTVLCITNPKACFGSCPTFYAYNGEGYVLQAEGFSSSISPCLEESDIDALYNVKPTDKNFSIEVRNEAYETHVIRKANILAVHRNRGDRVFSTDGGKFYEIKNLTEATQAMGEEGDCSEKLCSFDGSERFSPTDSNNLAEKEIIELSFDNVKGGNKGLVIASRQTLLTTFLFYQGLSYMGRSASDWLANLERNSKTVKEIIDRPRKVLGRIEVFVEKEDGSWDKAGEIGEHGPIATDIKIVPFETASGKSSVKIKLKMTKGLWRIDHAALADIVGEASPILITPSGSFPENTAYHSNVTQLLTNNDSVLVTFPGDKYFLNYSLPDDYENYELFLESRGYYLEWMRNEWLAEEDPLKVTQMFFNPKQFFKDLAPQFKKVEAEMEESFWSSKYVYP